MARQSKDLRTEALPSGDDSLEQEQLIEQSPHAVKSISAALAEAMSQVGPGPEHGALAAIESALVDLKARAVSVAPHLRMHVDLLARIKSL